MAEISPFMTATEIAAAVKERRHTARSVTETMLARIDAINPQINAYTDVTADRALAEADAVDAAIAAGTSPGPLAGVPYAVKNLFDLKGLPTRAGSKINRDRAPATQDADLVQRLKDAGAICLGGLNMGEYAYDFTGENAHDGACRNPHALDRMSGGSSSGSGAATAAGLAPISLGSDTNGSLRVPASLCGVFSLKPTYGRLTRGGTFPFVDSLDHLGPFARSTADLALSYDVLQGPAGRDHGCAGRAVEPTARAVWNGVDGLRIGVPRGWFDDHMGDDAKERREKVVQVLSGAATIQDVTLAGVEAGRAAAYLITNAESATFHLPTLRKRTADYDPDTRDRFLAGALLPAAWLEKAQRVRHWWLHQMLTAFQDCDLMLVPATPVSAPLIGGKVLTLGGVDRPLRPFLGLLSQPFSAIGLPVVTVPVFAGQSLPIGMQLIAPPWREDIALRAAAYLEAAQIAAAVPPHTLLERTVDVAQVGTVV